MRRRRWGCQCGRSSGFAARGANNAREYLAREHGIAHSTETLCAWMLQEQLWKRPYDLRSLYKANGGHAVCNYPSFAWLVDGSYSTVVTEKIGSYEGCVDCGVGSKIVTASIWTLRTSLRGSADNKGDTL